MSDPIIVASVARTPIGGMQGELSSFAAHQLGAHVIKAAVDRAGLAADQVQEVIMGCVLTAGQGQAPARQAMLRGGLPASVGATTINKMCGSGMKAVMWAHDAAAAGAADVFIAGGMESMTNAPYLMLKGRGGYRYGHATLFDHMALDGLEDAYEKTAVGGGASMGQFAENTADKYSFTREAQDAYAITSTKRAVEANSDGTFGWEIAPITVEGRTGPQVIDKDEQPFKSRPEKVPQLKPAFRKDGTVTAATSSSISDGAAALTVMRLSTAKKLGCTPLARIVAHATHSQSPEWFTIAPIGAIAKLYAKTGWTTDTVDLFEVNEAFAVVTMATMCEHKIPHEKINVHGGACALGHPIGATGARIIVTLLGALRKTGNTKGVAALCIGGGEATAVAVEML